MSDDDRLLVGRYRVGPLIGHGGMSEVHTGIDTRLGRTVAIKLLKSTLATDPTFRTRFRQEAQAAARMSHPTIVRVFDAGEETITDTDGSEVQLPFIVMEKVEGRLLSDRITDGPLEADEACRIAAGILTALEYSHRAGVVHRDIKPGNIMITPRGQIKVMDFGIARAVSDSSSTVAQTTAIMGTANYFSPEQARGEAVDARTDLYSAGIVLFEMLTGRPPFHGETAVSVAYRHISETPMAPSSLNPQVSPALDLVVERALAKDRFDRYQSAADFRHDLDEAAAGRVPTPAKRDEFSDTLFGPPTVMPTTTEATFRALAGDKPSARTRTHPPVVWLWAGVTVVAVAVVVALAWIVLRPNLDNEPSDITTVPAVAGMSFADAAQTLADDQIRWDRGDDEYSDTVDEGDVIRTEPGADAEVSRTGDNVTIIVSRGQKLVTIPAVSNQSLDDAKATLDGRGLTVGSINHENSPTIPKDVVIDTDPEHDSEVAPGSSVDLVVSTGNVSVPDVTGDPVADASDLLKSGDLQLEVSLEGDDSCVADSDTPVVEKQNPGRGDRPQGSTVTLTYCTGTEGG